jgi:hypothetical protein
MVCTMPVWTWRYKSRRKRSRGTRGISRWFSCALVLFTQLALCGQTLQISSAKASRGKRVTLQVVLTSPAGREPLGLQWETIFPADQLVPLEGGISLGPVTRAAGKSVQCAAKPQAGGTSGTKCILIGGQKPIPNGVIALLQFSVLSKAPEGSARVRVDPATAVFKDLKQTQLPAVEAVVKIR